MTWALTTFSTVLVGTLVFVVGQTVLKFLIEPIQEQKKLIGAGAHALVYYDNAYLDKTLIQGLASTDPNELDARREELREASKEIRDLAGRLQGSLWTIPYYDTFARWGRVPRWNDVVAAVIELRAWSNGLVGGDAGARATQHREAIARKLGITRKVLLIDEISITSTGNLSIEREVIRKDDEDNPAEQR